MNVENYSRRLKDEQMREDETKIEEVR